jgi:maltose/moltooligosaccharide transporter
MAMMGLVGGIIGPFINPIVSAWSDRYRSPMGRRRPFLFWATPFFAFFLAITPYMFTLNHYLLRFPWWVELGKYMPLPSDLMLLSVTGFIGGMFNAVVMAIFSYLYWDVVPETHIGRFQSLSKIVVTLAGLVWNFFIFGLGEHHIKAVFVTSASLMLVIYMVSVWQIKEGEYPPPDVHKKGGSFTLVRAYIVECFGDSYFLWIFAASMLFQFGNTAGAPLTFYIHYDLKLSLWDIGWANGWGNTTTTTFGLICGFAIGAYTDRVKGVRLLSPLFIIWSLLIFSGYFFVTDKWTLMIYNVVQGLFGFSSGIIFGAFTIEVFPMEKLGQFCSAQAFSYQILLTATSPFLGMFWDHFHHYFRAGYLFQSFFFLMAGLCYFKVYLNWKKRHGHPPLPHAG